MSSQPTPRLLQALASLNQIGATINRIGPDDNISPEVTLQLIVESATRVVPGSSAVIYTYDADHLHFNHTSRVSAGAWDRATSGDEPRPAGLGQRAIAQQRVVLSYEEPDLGIHPVKARFGVKTAGCFPLFIAEQPVGALYVYLRRAREFSQLELLMLENFVNQAAMAIYHSHRLDVIRRDLARKEGELAQLRRAGLLISSRLRLEETLESILQMALEVTNAHYGIFRLLDKGGQNLITRAFAGEELAEPQVETLPIEANSVMSHVARSRQPILIPDLRAEPWSHIYYPFDTALEMRSELAVPLINASGRLEGILNLESPQINAFSEADSHLLQALATQAVTAIQEVRLLDALQEIAGLLLVQPCEMALEQIAERACDLLNAAASAIWQIKGDDLVLAVASGGHRRGQHIPIQNSLTGLAVLERRTVIAENVATDPHFHHPELAHAQGWQRALIVPLLGNDGNEPLGAFSVYSSSSEPGRFAESEWDKKVLLCLAQYAGLAFQNAARQDALRAAQEQRSVAETFAAVGDIASNLLHHLNNKVGTIPVRVQGIQDKCRLALDADSYLSHNLEEIERCASEAMESVRENLSHLRPIRLEPVYVAARVMDAIHAAKLPPGIEIRAENLETLPVVVASGRSLTLVFTNLLENAADAMRGEGKITLHGTAEADWVEITVSDNGPGVHPDLHDRIFELNFSRSATPRPGKLGFGLWWVKTLMTRLGGSVSVESDGQSGATFRLRLPRVGDV
ncbi:MAG: GAF domain-containing protein [Chloroflexota bacterium]